MDEGSITNLLGGVRARLPHALTDLLRRVGDELRARAAVLLRMSGLDTRWSRQGRGRRPDYRRRAPAVRAGRDASDSRTGAGLVSDTSQRDPVHRAFDAAAGLVAASRTEKLAALPPEFACRVSRLLTLDADGPPTVFLPHLPGYGPRRLLGADGMGRVYAGPGRS